MCTYGLLEVVNEIKESFTSSIRRKYAVVSSTRSMSFVVETVDLSKVRHEQTSPSFSVSLEFGSMQPSFAILDPPSCHPQRYQRRRRYLLLIGEVSE